tara:strand:- start:1173 stop:1727 length:555 start_codon:yes stop_codon:yes gene_type:complete
VDPFKSILENHFEFRFLRNFPVESFYPKLDSLTEEDWTSYTYRQETYAPHADTQCIPIVINKGLELGNSEITKYYSIFEDEIKGLYNAAFEVYGKGLLVRCMLTRLPGQKCIHTHRDVRGTLITAKRIHLPLITNDKIKFKVGEVIKVLKEGELWEINNSERDHAVYNESNKDRIHLIYDYYPI